MKRMFGNQNKRGSGASSGDDDDDAPPPPPPPPPTNYSDVADVFGKKTSRTTTMVDAAGGSIATASRSAAAASARPSYRVRAEEEQDDESDEEEDTTNNQSEDEEEEESDDDDSSDDDDAPLDKAGNIEKSAGTNRLNRILKKANNTTASTNQQGGEDKEYDDDDVDLPLNKQRRGTKGDVVDDPNNALFGGGPTIAKSHVIRVSDPHSIHEISQFCGKVVIPPLKIESQHSIGGQMLDNIDSHSHISTLIQECIYVAKLSDFESTTGHGESVALRALQYPKEYNKHKRGLGLLFGNVGGGMNKQRAGSAKLKYVLLVRSTNRPLVEASQERQRQQLLHRKKTEKQKQQQLQLQKNKQQNLSSGASGTGSGGEPHGGGSGTTVEGGGDDSERKDYDAMFSPDDDDDDVSKEVSMRSDPDPVKPTAVVAPRTDVVVDEELQDTASDEVIADKKKNKRKATEEEEDDEISSFPVLVCLTLHPDGTSPDIRKLIPLHELVTVQDLHSTVIQLAFHNGDTIRLDFGNYGNDPHNERSGVGRGVGGPPPPGAVTSAAVQDRPLDKEQFVWSLLQIHAMLCMAVVERNSRGTTFLPPLNVRNLDRAELQYLATVNGFLTKDESLKNLLERQYQLMKEEEERHHREEDDQENSKLASPEDHAPKDMDAIAYDLMMGNFATRVTLFHSEEERKDAEEILNLPEWTDMLTKEETAAMSIAERLQFMLMGRMRDLEAETCRRLIAWEDEKHLSGGGKKPGLHDDFDARDTVDALALASLFKTLESLDAELKGMEDWLQERAAAIKPLTDDCADIEEENRQLEQQWKSYDMLGSEMRRLLKGHEIDDQTRSVLDNPAQALVYDEDGLVDVDESEEGIERIYEAGKSLLDAMEFPRKSGGIHLKAVAERLNGLTSISNTYCSALAQIIVTVMEQFKTEVVAGSDYGKVSKNDTHTMISKKIRDTQRKFQSALLGYIKLIEILAALSPDMLPALRESYAEMVSEGILMKKRMKGYFQALPAKNAAYMNKAGKNLKDYVPFDVSFREETVNAPDIRNALSELLPVIAREAYFTSALFGSTNRDQDGREKKRNFENAKSAVDKASQHFRYYVSRTCGIVDMGQEKNEAGEAMQQRSDALLCLVATIYLNESMDNYIDREKKGGDHSLSLAYVRATILDLRKKADKQWVAWVDRQLEWIKSNDGVPLTGKRAGIFPSFARFPVYLDHVVLCCREGRDDDYMPDLPGIKVINYYLQKMAVTLLESLKDCAGRETTDQTYAANVMQMENTYFFTQAIKERGEMMSRLFAKQVTKANAICKESTDAYLGWMIKREFTALHELFSRVSKLRKEVGDHDVQHHVPKQQFLKVLQKEANRTMLKEKIQAMFSRMEKHLSEEGGLLPVAWKALVKVLYEWFGRWEKLCTALYRHKLDPSAVDVVRIAKAAGGAAKPKAPVPGNEFGFKSILALGNKEQTA